MQVRPRQDMWLLSQNERTNQVSAFGYFSLACLCLAGAAIEAGGGLLGVLLIAAAWAAICAIYMVTGD